MAYYLTIKRGRNLRNIDISNLEGFSRNSEIKTSYMYSLYEIDRFTSNYDDEFAFREDLYNNGIINGDEITGDIFIRMKYKGKFIKLGYGLVYKDNFKYFDISYLISIILERSNDYNFLEALLDEYSNCNGSSKESIALIRNIKSGNHRYSMSYALSEFFNYEVYDRKWNADIRDYKYSIRYKALHNLAMFVYNYDNKCDEEIRKVNLDKFVARVVYGLKSKGKKRRPIKEESKELDGQMSIGDLL